MISAIILTHNEEKNIKDCLDSVSWCDEKIVIDDNSSDNTVHIAKKAGAFVFSQRLNSFSEQRNFGLHKASGDWVLFLDADERISSALWYEIIQRTNEPIENSTGFLVNRVDVIWGKKLKYGESGSTKFVRLAKKNSGQWVGDVHEVWKIKGKIKDLNNPLYHYPHQSIAEFLKEINHYTELRAKELFKKKTKTNWLFIIIYPKYKFIANYIFRLGFLDGVPGLISALMMSFHSFLVRGKLWLLWESGKPKIN
jgi:glycosyltransferase involved in cell wall biosynthesis